MPGMQGEDRKMENRSIRFMLPGDVKQVAQLEAESFSSPWTEEDFARDLLRPEYFFLVCEDREGQILAYAGVRVVLDEAEITTIAVKESERRRGLGRKLLISLQEACLQKGVTLLHLEVRKSNAAARHLYETTGFSAAGERKNYYEKPRENAVLMTAELSGGNFH